MDEVSRQSLEGQDQEKEAIEKDDVPKGNKISSNTNENEDSRHDSKEESDPYTDDEEEEESDGDTQMIPSDSRNKILKSRTRQTPAKKSRLAFPCNQCNKGYTYEGALKQHIHFKHNPLAAKVLPEKDFSRNV